jgi:transcription initiation factor TFIIIB Brf1 subunit/transcription initiation factor TFIIB
MNCRKCNKKLSAEEEQNKYCFDCLYGTKDNVIDIYDF